MKAPSNASSANQATLPFPWETTMNAASNGPSELPAFPPSWNNDCAKPRRAPAAMCATREASGWKIAEPSPMTAAEMRMSG